MLLVMVELALQQAACVLFFDDYHIITLTIVYDNFRG